VTARIGLERMPQFGGDNSNRDRQLRDALDVAQRNFHRLRDTIERAILTGGLVGDGTITEAMLSAAAKTLAGDVTGTIGATGSTTVGKLLGKTIPALGAGGDDKLLRYDHGSNAFTLESVAELLDDILTTSGDLLYRSGSSITRLGVGSAYSILAVNAGGTAPAYATLSALLDAALGNTQGNILYRGASGWAVLAPGTSGQVLQTNGAAANPSWEDAASGGTPPTDFDLLTNGVDELVFAGGDVVWIV
jgi:hypothetical protein